MAAIPIEGIALEVVGDIGSAISIRSDVVDDEVLRKEKEEGDNVT